MNTIRILFISVSGLGLLFLYNNCSGQFKNETASETSSISQSQSNCRLIKQEPAVNPQTIDQVVQLINQIQKPVTIPCLLSFLPKPMKVYAVDNAANAQPSAGPQSPRIFLFNKNLILSVVPEGTGKDVIELSDVTGIFRSVKAEILFPVVGEILPSEPYLRVATAQGSSCRGCHSNESRDPSVTSAPAYVSDMVFPNSAKKVDQPVLLNYARNCNPAIDAFRCAMLKTIFIEGQAVDSPFLAAPVTGN